MDPDVAGYAIEFLKRVQLQGAEVPAFNAVMTALIEVQQENGGGDVVA